MTRESGKKPTRSRCPGSASLGWGGWTRLVLVLVAASLTSCTTAQEREDPASIWSQGKFQPSEIAEHIHATRRSGALYRDFRTVLLAEVIFQDEKHREWFRYMLKERYQVAPEELAAMARMDTETFENKFEFLVLVTPGRHEKIRLNQPGSLWKIMLKDDDGHLLSPVLVEKINPDQMTYHYLEQHYPQLNRWQEVYRVGFPKLEKTRVSTPLGAQPFQLLLTGVEGTVTLQWNDPALFYLQGVPSSNPR
ncbi:MAG: hypothetical protein OEV94_04100 [Deltaproteobacteria bacterium]|nr:hypothetical protein [Deltaproteobacteria bacterium]